MREHADATEAALTLTHLDDRTVLDIADNGRGFTPSAPAVPRGSHTPASAHLRPPAGVRGHGLPAMRARLHQLGGTLTIESAPGEGTVVSAEVPLPAPAPSPEEPS